MRNIEVIKKDIELKEATRNELNAKIRAIVEEDVKALDRDDVKEMLRHENAVEKDLKALKGELAVAERFNVQVGDGVTVCYWTDANAYTVIAKSASGKKITLQRDKTTLKPEFKPDFVTGGFAAHCTNQEEQDYTYERDENGTIMTAYWSEKFGRFMADKTLKVVNGRHEFYDYNF